MVRTTFVRIAIAAILTVGTAGLWLLISEKQSTQEHRAKVFGTPKQYPTSGGEKMKVEW